MRSLTQELDAIRQAGLYRSLRSVDSDQGAEIEFKGRRLVNFSSNNYLGLANHPRLKRAATQATEAFGTGSGASRLITGSMSAHAQLEEALARFKGTEAALVFNSGYHANLGILTALLQEGDEVYSDEFNHASIVDGCRLSKASVKIFRHSDADHLEELLKQGGADGRRLIVTDSVFSMDGDLAPLKEIAELAERFEAWLLVDEAHATGVFGPNGKGLVEEVWPLKRPSFLEERLIQMGTLGKALGSFGAYAAGSAALAELLINKARPFIYTTALPPAVCAASLEALRVVEEEPLLRKKLWENVRSLGEKLKSETVLSPIVPWKVGDTAKALELSGELFEQGLWVTAIRFPTVPRGTERLRITLMATHTKEMIDRLAKNLNSK